MLNDALNKIKRNAAAASSHSDSHQTSVQQTHQSLLLNHHKANDFGHHVLHHLTTSSSLGSATTGPGLMASTMLLPETKASSEQPEPQSVDAGRHYRFAKSLEPINSAPNKNGSPAKKHKSNNSSSGGGGSVSNNNNNYNSNNNNNNNTNCNSASTTLTNSATSSTISTHESATNDGSADRPSFFDIHEKLRELYVYLYLKDMQDAQVENRVSIILLYIHI